MIRCLEANDQMGEGRLATAGLADESEGFTPVQLEGHIADSVGRSGRPQQGERAGDREQFRHVADLDDEVAYGPLAHRCLGRADGRTATARRLVVRPELRWKHRYCLRPRRAWVEAGVTVRCVDREKRLFGLTAARCVRAAGNERAALPFVTQDSRLAPDAVELSPNHAVEGW